MKTTQHPTNVTASGVAALTTLKGMTARRVRELWQRPSVAVARALVGEYLESGRVIAEAAALAVFFFFAFRNPGTSAHFFEAAHAGLGALAVLAGVIATAHMLHPRVYMSLAQRYGSAACARGVALALTAVRMGSYVYLLSMALLAGRIADASLGALVAGSLGLLANVILLALVAAALCPPFVTSRQRIGFLLWLVAALYSYAGSGFLASVCTVARLPLLPFGALFAAGVMGSLGWGGLLALVVVAGYALGIVRFLAWRLETRTVPADAIAASES